MANDLKTQRVQVLLSSDELKAIDDWSFAHRIRSRGEAMRMLIGMGLWASATVYDEEAQSIAEEAIAKYEAIKRRAR